MKDLFPLLREEGDVDPPSFAFAGHLIGAPLQRAFSHVARAQEKAKAAGGYDDAIAELRHALAITKMEPLPFYNLAVYQLRVGKFDLAIRALQKAEKLLIAKCSSHEKERRHSSRFTEMDISKSIFARPQSASSSISSQRRSAPLSTQQPSNSSTAETRLREYKLLYSKVQHNLAICFAKEGQPEKAAEYFSRNSGDGSSDTYRKLGLLARANGNYREASLFYQRATRIDEAQSPKKRLDEGEKIRPISSNGSGAGTPRSKFLSRSEQGSVASLERLGSMREMDVERLMASNQSTVSGSVTIADNIANGGCNDDSTLSNEPKETADRKPVVFIRRSIPLSRSHSAASQRRTFDDRNRQNTQGYASGGDRPKRFVDESMAKKKTGIVSITERLRALHQLRAATRRDSVTEAVDSAHRTITDLAERHLYRNFSDEEKKILDSADNIHGNNRAPDGTEEELLSIKKGGILSSDSIFFTSPLEEEQKDDEGLAFAKRVFLTYVNAVRELRLRRDGRSVGNSSEGDGFSLLKALVEVNDELRSKEKATLAKIDAALNAEANEPEEPPKLGLDILTWIEANFVLFTFKKTDDDDVCHARRVAYKTFPSESEFCHELILCLKRSILPHLRAALAVNSIDVKRKMHLAQAFERVLAIALAFEQRSKIKEYGLLKMISLFVDLGAEYLLPGYFGYLRVEAITALLQISVLLLYRRDACVLPMGTRIERPSATSPIIIPVLRFGKGKIFGGAGTHLRLQGQEGISADATSEGDIIVEDDLLLFYVSKSKLQRFDSVFQRHPQNFLSESIKSKREKLMVFPQFLDQSHDKLLRIADFCEPFSARQGECILEFGERSPQLFLLFSGRLSAWTYKDNGYPPNLLPSVGQASPQSRTPSRQRQSSTSFQVPPSPCTFSPLTKSDEQVDGPRATNESPRDSRSFPSHRDNDSANAVEKEKPASTQQRAMLESHGASEFSDRRREKRYGRISVSNGAKSPHLSRLRTPTAYSIPICARTMTAPAYFGCSPLSYEDLEKDGSFLALDRELIYQIRADTNVFGVSIAAHELRRIDSSFLSSIHSQIRQIVEAVRHCQAKGTAPQPSARPSIISEKE